MKKILILGLLLVSHLWGLKEWTYSCVSYNCREDDEAPKIPDDYKPAELDTITKIKVGNVEGEIISASEKGLFIKGNKEKTYKFVDSIPIYDFFFIDYPNYTIAVDLDTSVKNDWSYVDFYQIFAADDGLEMFKLFNDTFSILSCDTKDGDSPCPLTKEYILDWIKKQGGQEFFDYACPAYYDKLNSVCSEGVLREPTCQEAKGINPYVDGCED